ncbi:Ig-like domain-containing protein [Streptomyces sp. S.PB5]|uniref:L,D-transpeptidase family protein n=1 Tax=Streptomyces sp. S.PB5 TaxID=3020844 RepID=UPI0025B15490|nr:Ig-like domain-containing protein [Streptomyces sp. S.PB5]MDN3026009.1 Ig-like domain-containing protein [Streptomyces sp. S.PB5]
MHLGSAFRITSLAGTAAAVVVALTVYLSDSAVSGIGDAETGPRGLTRTEPRISVNLNGGQARAGRPVRVTVTEGTLRRVTVTDSKGAKLRGTLSAKGTSWTSARNAAPGTSYTVVAQGSGHGTATAHFTTAAPRRVNKLTMTPGDRATVGIAQPLSIVFDHPVRDKAEVEEHLRLTTSNNTVGSWGWMRDRSGRDRVDWRPMRYWSAGTKVTLRAELNGIDSGPAGGWFVRDYTTAFTVGSSQVVKVDLDDHRLTLLRDGIDVGHVPVSGGTPGGEKASWRGRMVLLAKEGTIRMRSSTVGLGDAYDRTVHYSMRLTWSGMYAHAAPWNRPYFGRANRSSGCVGMSDADARWLYGHVRVGDPFEVRGRDTKGTQAPNNGFGVWNLSWSAWRARSALS